MVFEKINADDTLNQGRIKINNIGEAVNSKVSELKEDLINEFSVLYNSAFNINTIENGSIKNGEKVSYQDAYRVRTAFPFVFANDITLNNGGMYVCVYNKDTNTEEVTWSSEKVTLTKGVHYTILWCATPGSAAIEINPSYVLDKISIEVDYGNLASKKYVDNKIIFSIRDIEENHFEKGSLGTNGVNGDYHIASRIRSKYIFNNVDDIIISPRNGAYIQAFYYNVDGTYKGNSSWRTSSLIITKNSNFRLLLTLNPNTDVEKTISEIYDNYNFGSDIDIDKEATSLIKQANRHFDTEQTGTWTQYNKTGLPTFAHITDIHGDSVRFNNFFNYTRQNFITRAICTGDVVNTASVDGCFDYINGTTTTVLFAVGNHDREGITKEKVKQKLMPTRDNTYYYLDFDDIRIIILDQCDQSDSGTSGGVGQYTQTQIDWFINTLKNAKTNNKSVLIGMHSPEKTPVKNNLGFYQRHYQWTQGENEYISYSGGTIIEDIIDAFKNGKTINKTYRSITVNTTFENDGKFIAYMCGHYHADMIGYSQTYDDQLYLLCDQGRCTNNSASDLARYEDGKSANCFNVYTIDTTKKLIKIVRVGADYNDILERRKLLVISY